MVTITSNCKDVVIDIKNGLVMEMDLNKSERRLRYLVHDTKGLTGYTYEIFLNLDPTEIQRLFPEIFENIIVHNVQVKDGLITSKLTNAPVEFKLVDKEKNIIRVIFSDENLLLPSDPKCNPVFKTQYDGLRRGKKCY